MRGYQLIDGRPGGVSDESIKASSKTSRKALHRNDLNGLIGWNELNDYCFIAQPAMCGSELWSNLPMSGSTALSAAGFPFLAASP